MSMGGFGVSLRVVAEAAVPTSATATADTSAAPSPVAGLKKYCAPADSTGVPATAVQSSSESAKPSSVQTNPAAVAALDRPATKDRA
jgi:hypothetical protein